MICVVFRKSVNLNEFFLVGKASFIESENM